VATTERVRDRGNAQANAILRSVGIETRTARRGAGLSILSAASSVGLDPTTFARLERAALPNVTVRQLALACAAVGLKLAARPFLDGDPVRDAGHRRLLDRFRACLPATALWRTEVPLPIPGDRRAVDAITSIDGRSIGVEAETHLADLQGVERRVLLKQRDAQLDLLVLLVADTKHNRLVLDAHRRALRASFPLDTRGVLASLRSGMSPPANGIVVL